MNGTLIRKLSGNTNLFLLKLLANLWGPFLGSGIKVTSVTPDFRKIQVTLKRRWYNSNYVGTQFGGSIYAMTDPFYMMMLMVNLGRNYIVWDKAAEIRFLKPGKTKLFAEFELSETEIESIKKDLTESKKIDWQKEVLVKNTSNEIIASVLKTIYIRRK